MNNIRIITTIGFVFNLEQSFVKYERQKLQFFIKRK